MSNLPIDAYKRNGNPITNYEFTYGTLLQGRTASNSEWSSMNTNYGSLQISQISGNLCYAVQNEDGQNSISYYGIEVYKSGVYRLRTSMWFGVGGFTTNANATLLFVPSNVYNGITTTDAIGATTFSALQIRRTSNNVITDLTENTILSFGHMYTAKPASNTSPQDFVNFGNQDVTDDKNAYFMPKFNIPCRTNTDNGNLYNDGATFIELILYLRINNPLYFNVSANASRNIKGVGNFTLELLHSQDNFTPNSNPTANYTHKTINNYVNTFFYGRLETIRWSGQTTSDIYAAYNLNYGSLGLSTSGFYGNRNLVQLNTNTVEAGLKVNYTGIYRLRTTLSFTGNGFGPNTNQTIGFAFTSTVLANVTLTNLIPLNENSDLSNNISINRCISLGYLFSPNGPSYNINSNSTFTVTLLCNSTSDTGDTLDYGGISVVEVVLYLVKDKPLFFNISPGGGNNDIAATGNYMLELLSVADPVT